MLKIKPKARWRENSQYIFSPARLASLAHWGEQSSDSITSAAGASLLSFAIFSMNEKVVYVPKELEPALLLLLDVEAKTG